MLTLHMLEELFAIHQGHNDYRVGGQSKNATQIKGLENAYLAIDGIEIGFATKIPLYLFGMLY